MLFEQLITLGGLWGIRSDLRIVVNGIGKSSVEFFPLNKVCFTTKSAEQLARNYDKLVLPLLFKTKVNYINLAKAFNFQIPANFF